MAAQSDNRRVERIDGYRRSLPVKANAVCFQGALAVMSGAVVQPGAVAANLRTVGIFEAYAKGGAADGAVEATVVRGTYKFANDGAAAVTAAHIGSPCYVLDDQTVSSSHDTNARSIAGIVFDVDSDGVWVTI
jgi:hypothetical protein